MAFYVYTSNRLEILADQLAVSLSRPQADPLAPEIIMVQSRGMERWVSLRLARSLGICSNILWPFPNQFFTDTVRNCLPGLPETAPFERESLTWRIFELLPQLQDPGPSFYLRGDTGLKLYQLACRMADLFDQYAVYRPDMLAAWEAGRLCHGQCPDEHWQAILWRALMAQSRGMHRGRLLDYFTASLKENPAAAATLPARVAVFGMAALPPYHIRFLDSLAAYSQVHLFLLNPCREYWGDILSEKQAVRRLAKQRGEDPGMASERPLHLNRGNSLLAALGDYGREFHELLLAKENCIQQETFSAAESDSLLACLQNDILELRDRGEASEQKTPFVPGDSSLQIHVCHSPMREVEVLHDALLGFFERNPGLAPHEILVMTPDIETYGPFIQAVFSAAGQSERIAYSLADRSFLHVYPLYEGLLCLLGITGSRYGAPQILQLLDIPALRQRFGFTAGDVELIRGWVIESRIRWGRNADGRSREGFPATDENTWQAGLDRLLLGYAMPGQTGELFKGMLPCSGMEGGTAQVLGRLAEFMSTLFAFSDRLQPEKTLASWSGLLQDMLNGFFLAATDEESRMLDEARKICSQLSRMQELSGFTGMLKLEIVREYLQKAFSRRVTAAGFLTGSVTVCAMLPMRSIPFRIICLLGMNDGTFPRVAQPPAFNLIARYGRPCDRSIKKDDRYLFLETLLSAGQTLYISYTGQNLTDNAVIPPSTLVSQVLDYIEQGFTCEQGPVRDQVLFRHRLQPFNPSYFQADSKLRSYSQRDFACAQAIRLGETAVDLPPFFTGDLPQPQAQACELALDQLCAFLVNPAKYMLQNRLGIYFDSDRELVQDREPFALAGLEKYSLEQELLERRLAGAGPEHLYALSRASGVLPHGMPGELACESCLDRMTAFIDKACLGSGEISRQAAGFSLQLDCCTLTGILKPLRQEVQLLYRYGRAKPADFLRAWMYHLALCATDAGERTLLFALDGKDSQPAGWRFTRPDNPLQILGGLLALYRQGLCRPLPLFPRASYRYSCTVAGKKKSEGEAFQSALEAFEGDEYTPGDLDDPYTGLCFRDGLFDEDLFRQLAQSVYGELLAHREALT